LYLIFLDSVIISVGLKLGRSIIFYLQNMNIFFLRKVSLSDIGNLSQFWLYLFRPIAPIDYYTMWLSSTCLGPLLPLTITLCDFPVHCLGPLLPLTITLCGFPVPVYAHCSHWLLHYVTFQYLFMPIAPIDYYTMWLSSTCLCPLLPLTIILCGFPVPV
jgi:hypothetical protein